MSNKSPPAKPSLPSAGELGQPDARRETRKRPQPRSFGRPRPVPSEDAGGDIGYIAVRGVGQLHINDEDTLKIAEVYMKKLRELVTGRETGVDGA